MILVTGGAGFIGSNIVEALITDGYDIFVIDDMSTGSLNNLKDVEAKTERRGYFNDKFLISKKLSDALKAVPKPDVIVHYGIPSSSPMYKANHSLVGSAINDFISVLDFANETGAKVIYASSSSVYNGIEPPHSENMKTIPSDYYTEARITMERLAEMYHKFYQVDSVGFRMFSVYGPRERAKGKYANIVTQMILSDKFTIYGSGEQTRDFIHVHDVVRAVLLAVKKKVGCEVLNLGTGKETSFNEVANLVGKHKKLSISYAENPIKNYVDRTCADTREAYRVLGFKAEIPLDESIEKLVGYYSKGGI